ATGFDAERVKESPLEKMSRMTIEDMRGKEKEEKKERITYPEKMEPKMIIPEKVPPKPQRTINVSNDTRNLEEDDDDELEIPAFIRRKMGK
ncbi:MAG TPA: hypothetical protein P5262_02655, partial [Candidatus Moranbacteria bacterium]|nr:hypothetical protein [Candidatus Moranbacteria bacterium]